MVIGAGMAGILSAIKLLEAGLDDFAVYEKGASVGGTWRENTYPGLSCDVPSHFYSYSFAPNPDWSHRFSPGAEILDYFEDVARRYGVDARIRYGKEVTGCAFRDGRWRIETSDGATDEADFTLADGSTVSVPLMNGRSDRSGEGDGWVAASKQLVGGVVFEAVLPDDGRFDEVADRIDAVFTEFDTATNPGGALAAPRFETRVDVGLGEVLQRVGLTAPRAGDQATSDTRH